MPNEKNGFIFSRRPNRAHEINWRTWDDRAFAEALVEDKPVFLFIAAVWCHWCHVMDETSYSDPEIIRLLNEKYIPVRVDPDRRPDVNERYNRGGLPTTAILTPKGRTITGGTYVPPERLKQVLQEVAGVWREKREDFRRAEAKPLEDSMEPEPAAALTLSPYDKTVRAL
ncbi:MAG: thioredoxin domain-containing protein [Firmicutes bacterium]|nr:thioredoxin domain-containing protein [Bacillota bacterium]